MDGFYYGGAHWRILRNHPRRNMVISKHEERVKDALELRGYNCKCLSGKVVGEYVKNLIIFECRHKRITVKGLINIDCHISESDRIVCGHCDISDCNEEYSEDCKYRLFNDGGIYFRYFEPIKSIKEWVEIKKNHKEEIK